MKAFPKSYLDEKHFSFKNFLSFLSENKLLVFISTITIIIVFGVKLTTISFGIDSEIHIDTKRYLNWMEIGRFGLVGLQKLWSNFLPNQELFNPYLAVFLGCGFLLLGTLLWCFAIDLFSNSTIKKFAIFHLQFYLFHIKYGQNKFILSVKMQNVFLLFCFHRL